MKKQTKLLLIITSILNTLICGYFIVDKLIMGKDIMTGMAIFIIMVSYNLFAIETLTDSKGWYI